MGAVMKAPEAEAVGKQRTVQILTWLVVFLAAVATAGGLFVPGLYRESGWLLQAMRGTDLYTLFVALPAVLVALSVAGRGSLRAKLVLVGLLGYVLYTYLGGAFAFALNEFYLIYVALFALSIAALFAAVRSIDIPGLARRFDAAFPRGPVAAFLLLIGLMLAMIELGQIVPFITSGAVPEPLRLSGGTTFYPWTLDLGIVLPLSVLSAVWLWQRRPAGYLLTGCMLIKCVTMGLCLLAANLYGWYMGGTTDAVELLFTYGVIAFGGLAMSVWFLRHCRA